MSFGHPHNAMGCLLSVLARCVETRPCPCAADVTAPVRAAFVVTPPTMTVVLVIGESVWMLKVPSLKIAELLLSSRFPGDTVSARARRFFLRALSEPAV